MERTNTSWLSRDYAPVSPLVTKANLIGDRAGHVGYSSHSAEHIPGKRVQAFLAECRRVLNPARNPRLGAESTYVEARNR